MEKVIKLLEETQTWFERQDEAGAYAAQDAYRRMESVKSAVGDVSGDLAAYGEISEVSLKQLLGKAIKGEIPNPDWLSLKKLVRLAIEKRERALARLETVTSFPEDVRKRADVRYMAAVGEIRLRVEKERAARERAAGARGSSARALEISEDTLKFFEAIGLARLETLVEALRKSGRSVAPYRDLILREMAEGTRAAQASGADGIQRLEMAGALQNATAYVADLSNKAAAVMGRLQQKLDVEALGDEGTNGKSQERVSWRDPSPPEDRELEVLAMKRAFDRDIAAAVVEDESGPLSLLFIDVDDQKAMNERFTHPRVNVALAALARILDATARGRGKAYRYGGDEFALLLPNTSRGEGLAAGERIRVAVAGMRVPEVPELTMTVSVGVACLDDLSERTAKALEVAGATAAKRAKASGKNRVEGWSA